jgi:uncharacterized protein
MPVVKRALLIALVASLLLPAAAEAQTRTVTVIGASTQTVPNDAASLSFGVSKVRKTRQAALRVVAVRLRAVIAAVQSVPGVEPGDVTTGQISVRRVSRGKLTVYRAAEGIVVILHEPDRAGELVNVAIAAGATGSRGPSFFASDPELAYRNTLLAAFDQAKAKAAALATRAGAILGPALSIEESTEATPEVPQETTTRGPRGADQAPPAKPGTSTVTAKVRVVFALE